MKIFSVKTGNTDSGFRFVRLNLNGFITTISLDLVLAEQLDAILGGRRETVRWVNDVAVRLRAVMQNGSDGAKRHSGLSRLVSREGWRFVLDPDQLQIENLARLGKKHPLETALEK